MAFPDGMLLQSLPFILGSLLMREEFINNHKVIKDCSLINH